MKKPILTLKILKEKAKQFCINETEYKNPDLFGVTDGKAVGTYIEHKFQQYLRANYKIEIVSCAFIEKSRTADYTTTFRIREMLQDGANEEDIAAYLTDRNIPADELTLTAIAGEIIKNPPKQGYLTISNALQWRLQYGRIVRLENKISGINKIIDKITS